MGWNTVAVILNDRIHDFKNDGPIGKRLYEAHCQFRRDPRADFGAGSIISQDHADGYQVVIVHGNMGWRADNAEYDKYLGRQALDDMKGCLERNGYRVSKTRKLKETT